ncbi:hypothetical protein MWU61_18275 [Loktanella sp. F6476L]|uniref:hypothetical protein n=1 Tax=Loktanella sp. F6476L TaxID=2926405 RepID=UPI001FF53D43|nr:hypothetical protein [Loktanella sp. F6476L]MCK0122506.1 hypothetical protein [Loktanella sp. F6476L]
MQMLTGKTFARLMGATAIVLLAQNTTAQDGFSIAINGNQIAGDTRVVQQTRVVDLAIQQADVQVSFDGLGATPRLDLEIGTAANGQVTVQSALNYPAYVTRGELRLIDTSAVGGPRTVAVVPVTPNGAATIAVPDGDIAVIHRVYDAQGRFDETKPQLISAPEARTRGVEDGIDSTAQRGIPVYGGAITVSGENVTRGAVVTALGERVPTDRDGGFVLQRILPAGEYGVDVRVQGAGQNVALERDLTVPGSEFFYVATVDLTYGINDNDVDGRDTYDSGRVAFFVDGITDTGIKITASADSGEGDVRDIFRRLDDKDPRELLLRIDPRDLYPTYGDDSTLEDRTPTSGNVFLRIERDRNFAQWGDFSANLGGNSYVRNDRTLYGLSAGAASQGVTPHGTPRSQAYLYAAQPDQLPQRDVLQGTGGSVYFLDRQDIARASETLSVQVRDGVTGRVISTETLVFGDDYDINYIQGVVTLRRPLQSGIDESLIAGSAGTDNDVLLVAQYEYTPTIGDVDGFAYGGRAEGWVTDQLRVGASGMIDQTGIEDQTLVGADVMLRVSERTFVHLDYAESEGPGFGSLLSVDGGLIFDSTDVADGTGDALKVTGQAALVDLGLGGEGTVAAYYEDRSEGFSSLDSQVTATTGDETFWGLSADVAPRDGLRISGQYDDYENAVGNFEREARLEIEADVTPQIAIAAGLEYLDRQSATETGTRNTAAAKLTYSLSDTAKVFAFGRTTLDVDGLDDDDRYGIGGAVTLGQWELTTEVSDGSEGKGARILASYSDGQGGTRYAGYQLEPGRTLSGIDADGDDGGQFVAGGRSRVNDAVTVFGENTYDIFGNAYSLTSAYGLTYAPNDALSTTVAFEVGRVDDEDQNNFERNAISVGLQYADDKVEAQGRFEFRTEDGLRSGDDLRSDTLLFATDIAYKIDEDQRFVVSADLAQSDTDEADLLNGDYADVVLGYAYRPAVDDRLNLLARYRYLMDEFGQRVDGVDEQGPRQRSHVTSIDATYAVNQNWTLGGKLGYRMSETALTASSAFEQNDAWLAVASARYHLVNDWDALVEFRNFGLVQAETNDFSVLAAGYKQINRNVSIGVGYNFGRFSDDLTDLVEDDQGAFINLVASF